MSTARDSFAAPSLYAQLLGEAWAALPLEVRAMHDWRGRVEARGTATVERGSSVLARLVGKAIGFPAASSATPVTVRFSARDGVETWTRTFGAERFSSTQFAGRGRTANLLCERFAPFTFAMALVVTNGRLSLVVRSWRMLGMPLPLWLCPRTEAHESVADGLFSFHVEIRHRLTGLIVRYRGSLSSPTEVFER
jgi:hypothetical protein